MQPMYVTRYVLNETIYILRVTIFLLWLKNTWWKGRKMREPGSFQCCPVKGQESICTNWNMLHFIFTKAKENYSGGSKHRWPGRDTPGDIQNLTGQNHKQPDLPDRTWTRVDLKWPIPISPTLWFCDFIALGYRKIYYLSWCLMSCL